MGKAIRLGPYREPPPREEPDPRATYRAAPLLSHASRGRCPACGDCYRWYDPNQSTWPGPVGSDWEDGQPVLFCYCPTCDCQWRACGRGHVDELEARIALRLDLLVGFGAYLVAIGVARAAFWLLR